MQRLLAFLFLPLLGLFLSLPGNASASGRSTPTATHANVPHTDAQIDATIRMKLAKSKIGKDGFHFHVQHGVVTWEGSTNIIQHKGSATRMARTAGATQVINNIQISDAAKAKAAAHLKKASVVAQ
ncbi:MAG TPA: BON domain-containing protein [Bryobacteraceae bacterium]|nr:BON domain-containing protein [Bryobacteraceae bacterium]